MKKLILLFFIVYSQLSIVNSYSQSINLYEDSVHAPFVYGVASADPTDTSVLIWTAVIPDNSFQGETINWQVSADSVFSIVITGGTVMLDSINGYTIKIDATGLDAGMKYYYRFEWLGNYSVTGITYTAFTDTPDSLNLALVSCSSLFSGYFNGYRHLAEMPGMKGLIHVGDFIYDFVDGNEQIRVPVGLEDPNDTITEDWRERHRLYLTDPDLREARRKFPWIVTWDNHDVVRSNPGHSSQAFREFVPFREDPSDTIRIWRKVSYGPLLDIFMIDINIEGGVDTFPSGSPKAMYDEQFSWLKNGLSTSTAKWKFIGSEKLFAQWELGGLALPGSGLSKTWNGYPESRDSLLIHLRDNNVDNTVILSGDLHMNVWSDVALDPFDSITGNGSLAIEMMGTSLTRGNLDESGIPFSLQNNFETASMNANPHETYVNLFDHGFNYISLFNDSLVARSYLCPIITLNTTITLDATRICRAGENHWVRVSETSSVEETDKRTYIKVFPNPSTTGIFTVLLPGEEKYNSLSVLDATGIQCYSKSTIKDGLQIINLQQFSTGVYFLEAIKADGNRSGMKLVIQ